MLAEEFATMLEALPQRLESANYREPLEQTSMEIRESIGQNYIRMEDRHGRKWKPRKAKKRYGQKEHEHPLLRLTWAMWEASVGGENSFEILDTNHMEFGIRGDGVPYASIQNDGFSDQHMKIPAREYFYLHRNDRDKVIKRFGSLARIILDKNIQMK